ncbi:MAG: hypothetical protein KF878_13035 [Planctomycetes bacterium]|nr:hypothetical protein [Planctomycetota bacterium]
MQSTTMRSSWPLAALLLVVGLGGPAAAQARPATERLERFLAAAPGDPRGAAEALGPGDRGAVPALLDHLRLDLDALARPTDDGEALERVLARARAVCLALGRIGDPRALRPLCDLLGRPEGDLAEAASEGFLAIDHRDRLTLLVDAFRIRPSKGVATTLGRLHAALGARACLAALEGLHTPEAPADVRAAVLAGIARVEGDEARALVRRLARGGDALALAALSRHLDAPAGAEDLALLLDALDAGEPWARSTAAAALGRAGLWALPRTVPPLIEALEGGDPRLARHALASLERLTRTFLGPDAAAWRAWWAAREAEVAR